MKAGAPRSRPRRARGSINPADIVAGAFEFCRETPVEDLTMPQLAAFLNVGVTSIYWYFKSKRELLDAMTEEAVASFYESMPPLRGDSWEEMLREFFVSFYALLAGDELRCDLIVRRIGNHPDEEAVGCWARAEELLAALADAGFPPSLARHAFFTLSIYTQGYLLVERTGRTAGPISSPGKGAEPGAPTDPAAGANAREGFEFGITNIIRGLRVLVPGEAEESAVALRARALTWVGRISGEPVADPSVRVLSTVCRTPPVVGGAGLRHRPSSPGSGWRPDRRVPPTRRNP